MHRQGVKPVVQELNIIDHGMRPSMVGMRYEQTICTGSLYPRALNLSPQSWYMRFAMPRCLLTSLFVFCSFA